MRYGSEIVSTIGVIISAIAALVVLALIVGTAVSVLFWVMRDAESRGKPGGLVAILVLFLQIPGLILWLVFRPEKEIKPTDCD